MNPFSKSWKQLQNEKPKVSYMGITYLDPAIKFTPPFNWKNLIFVDEYTRLFSKKIIKHPIRTYQGFVILAWHLIILFGILTFLAWKLSH
jgi:hypothetical protein